MQLTKTQLEKFKKHVIKCYPEEAVALLVNGKVIPVQNVAENPLKDFRVAVSDYSKYLIEGNLQAVLHSHIVTAETDYRFDARTPSGADMNSQIRLNLPFGIVSTNGAEVSDFLWFGEEVDTLLEGREFIHGKYDCYSIIRDYYKQVLGIKLNNYPRELDWWDKGQDLYSENFEKENFKEVPFEDAQVHDVVLMQVRSPVINHAAVISGENEILHHLFHRLSGKDSLNRWGKQIVKVIRHKDSK